MRRGYITLHLRLERPVWTGDTKISRHRKSEDYALCKESYDQRRFGEYQGALIF